MSARALLFVFSCFCAATAGLSGRAAAQDPTPPRALDAAAFAALKSSPAPDPAAGSQDWVIRWTPAAAAASKRDSFVLLERRDLAVAMVRERDPQLAADRLVVIAVDAGGATVDWRIVADPTVLRAESADPAGRLSGRVLTQPTAELRVALAADPRISEIRIYKPRWTGSAFVLEPLGGLTGAR